MRNQRWTRGLFSERAATLVLCAGLLAAAWALPALGLWQHALERERMESGIYYTPQRPATAYLEVVEPS